MAVTGTPETCQELDRMGHVHEAGGEGKDSHKPSTLKWALQGSHHPAQPFHSGKTGGSPLGAALLFPARPSPAIPSVGSSSAGARAELQSIPEGMALPGRAAWLKGLHIRCP